MKKAGILQHISSMPSKYGIGDFGKASYEFVDLIEKNGLKTWQILPLNPLGYGNSPYQPYSSFAGEDIYIDLENLVEMGLLDEVSPFQEDSIKVDFDTVREYKETYYKKAFENFKVNFETFKNEFETFKAENSWLEMYSIFFSFKKANNLQAWSTWNDEMKFYPENKTLDLSPYEDEMLYVQFKQFLFFKQWLALKAYANNKGIEIIGDVPIYVAEDSQDVWENKEVFLFDENYNLTFVAGCPPDGFSADGQLWGNPIYNWEYLEKTDFDFLVNRFSSCGIMYDVTRIDHFLGFDRFWKIPGGDTTARNGYWEEAKGHAFFKALYKAFPTLNLIAEDLGSLRDETYALRDAFNLPGMKIFLWSIEGDKLNVIPGENMVAYTGTHDNDTLKTMIDSYDDVQLNTLKTKFDKYDSSISDVWNFIHMVLCDNANRVIIPTQDILELGVEARFNVPSTIGAHNWTWKLSDFEALKNGLKTFSTFIKKTNR